MYSFRTTSLFLYFPWWDHAGRHPRRLPLSERREATTLQHGWFPALYCNMADSIRQQRKCITIFSAQMKEPPDCLFNRMALYQSIWSFTLIISFQDYFRIPPDCFDPLFCFHLLSCPGKDRQFCFFCDFSFPDPVTLLLTFRSFPTMIKISSSHWTFPPFPETFMCLFRFGDSILQYLFLFVNSFLKIYLYFFSYLYFYSDIYSK